MAIAITKLLSGNTAEDPHTTSSIAPSDNALVLVGACLRIVDSDMADTNSIALSGGGMTTWTLIVDTLTVLQLNCNRRFLLWRSLEATPGSAALVLNYVGSSSLLGMTYFAIEATGVVTTGTNGADAYSDLVVKYNSAHNDISPDITITGTPEANDVTLVVLANEDDGTRTIESGWSAAVDALTGSETGHLINYDVDQDQTCVWADQTVDTKSWATVGMILKAGGGAILSALHNRRFVTRGRRVS